MILQAIGNFPVCQRVLHLLCWSYSLHWINIQKQSGSANPKPLTPSQKTEMYHFKSLKGKARKSQQLYLWDFNEILINRNRNWELSSFNIRGDSTRIAPSITLFLTNEIHNPFLAALDCVFFLLFTTSIPDKQFTHLSEQHLDQTYQWLLLP